MPRLLFALLHKRFTGMLQLDQPDPAGLRTIWFNGGMPMFTDWVSASHALGEVLVSEGLIDAEQLSMALRAMAKDGGLLGPVMVRLGLLDDAGLSSGLMRQCRRKVLETFALREGEVLVTQGPWDGPNFDKVNALELIGAGVVAHYDEARIEAEMGGILHGPLAGTEGLARYVAHFKFPANDRPLLDALAGATSFDSLSRQPGVSRRRAAQLVYTLWACQMLRVGASAVSISAFAGADTPEQAPRSRAPEPAPPRSRPTPTAVPAVEPRSRPTPTSVPPVADARAPRRPTRPGEAAVGTGELPVAEEAPQTPEQFMEELTAIEAKLARQAHAFDLLGITPDAGKREVRRAFGELSRRFHPDALQARGLGALRERVGGVFAALSEAQALLSDEQKREQLRDAIARGVNVSQAGADATAMARAAFESEVLAKDGDKFLKAGRWDRAHELYARALELAPDEPDLRAAEAFCAYNLSPRTRNDAMTAERALSAVLTAAPQIARAHYFKGLVLRDLGAIDPAVASLTRAVQLDPRLIDAERQARALRASRGPAPAEKPKGIRGMFGKK